jgi:replicative DNA helicase
MSAELEVIGQILMDSSKLQSCDLATGDFINSQYRDIYQAILDMSSSAQVIDPVSVSEYLEAQTGKQWLVTCGQVANKAYCFGTFDNQVEIVRKHGQLHRIKSILSIAMSEIDRTKSTDAVDRLISELMASTKTRNNFSKTLQDGIIEACEHLSKIAEIDGIPGITTGLKDLDDILGGFHDSDLVVVGARPAVGKTAFLINCALAASKLAPVGVISAEQGVRQMAERCLAITGSVDAKKLRNAKMSDDEWSRLLGAGAQLKGAKMHIYDEPGVSIGTVLKQAREWKFKYGIKALYVDYIQKISNTGHASKRDSVGEIAGSLKNLARELNIPVIALAQVNRDCERRDNKRPYQGDLADSSEIEKEADEIITLYRDEVYNEKTVDVGVAELLICKNRHGPTGAIRTSWIGQFMQFRDLSRASYDDY